MPEQIPQPISRWTFKLAEDLVTIVVNTIVYVTMVKVTMVNVTMVEGHYGQGHHGQGHHGRGHHGRGHHCLGYHGQGHHGCRQHSRGHQANVIKMKLIWGVLGGVTGGCMGLRGLRRVIRWIWDGYGLVTGWLGWWIRGRYGVVAWWLWGGFRLVLITVFKGQKSWPEWPPTKNLPWRSLGILVCISIK